MPDKAEVDHGAARKALDKAWADVGSDSRPPARMQQLIENVLSASDVTFKYILITGYLAKHVNPNVHARALQRASALSGAFDARSLCHKVVVGFEKSKGNLFGLSNEPFVNKPARHPEHDKDNPQLRNKILAGRLHAALEQAQSGSPPEVYQGLVHILRVGSQHAADEKQVKVTTRANLGQVLKFLESFLLEADGGARLVAVWGAFTALLCENGNIKVYSPNAADFFGKTAGDVEVYYDECLVSASECKQRPLNSDDVKHGINKCQKKGISEYHFVISAGIEQGHEKAVLSTIGEHSGHIDVALVDIQKEAELLAIMLNPARRARFGAVVANLLREMRKFESANTAVELWNKITARGSVPS